MKPRTRIVVVGLVAFVIGVAGGAAVGAELTTRFWYGLSKPMTVATGQQALVVLTLLDKKDEVTLRHLMEMEIDSTLAALNTMETAQHFGPDDPMSRLYQDLKRYRELHPEAGGARAPHK
jgi:hypothetical protein